MIKEMNGLVLAGELLLLSYGEYSDYGIQALVRANVDFDVQTLREQYLIEFPDERKEYSFTVSKFTGWLVRKGFVQDEQHREFHLGEYDCFEIEERYGE
jgi:hypothetical protein